jgi:hypothetical protein
MEIAFEVLFARKIQRGKRSQEDFQGGPGLFIIPTAKVGIRGQLQLWMRVVGGASETLSVSGHDCLLSSIFQLLSENQAVA